MSERVRIGLPRRDSLDRSWGLVPRVSGETHPAFKTAAKPWFAIHLLVDTGCFYS